VSLDANYILSYYINDYVYPPPMKKDIDYLRDKYGGSFLYFNNGYSIYWEKPKYTLPFHEYKELFADQILEKKDCELWEIVK